MQAVTKTVFRFSMRPPLDLSPRPNVQITMSRLALIVLLASAACSSTPSPVGPSSAPVHYTMQKWSTYTGKLALATDKATLTLQNASGTPNTLDGETRWENGKLMISVRQDDVGVTFTCDASSSQLQCTYEDDYTLFGNVGGRPQRIVFDRG